MSLLLVPVLLSMPAFAQQPPTLKNLNHPGIKWDWQINAGNYTFDVSTVSNYDMKNVTFNEINKELIFTGNSTHDQSIAEIEIPHNLIGGTLTVSQDEKPIHAIVISGTNSSTIMLKFNQTGLTTTSVVGTTYLPEFSSVAPLVMVFSIVIVLFTTRLGKL
jgi:hypothetical protein